MRCHSDILATPRPPPPSDHLHSVPGAPWGGNWWSNRWGTPQAPIIIQVGAYLLHAIWHAAQLSSTAVGAACRQAVGLPSLAADHLRASVLRLVVHTCCTSLPGQGAHTAAEWPCAVLSLLPMLFGRRRGRRARSQSRAPTSSTAREPATQGCAVYPSTATPPSSLRCSKVPALPCKPACSASLCCRLLGCG